MTVGLVGIGRDDPADVILVTGQSNAINVNGNSLASFSYLSAVDSGIKIWNGSSFDTLQNRVNSNPLNSGSNTLFGPEAEFAYRWRQANPTKTLYVVKYAVGSTPLANDGTTSNWSPYRNDGLFYAMEAHVSAAKAVLIGSNLRPVIRAEINIQGETDASTQSYANAYEVNKANYIAAVRTRWGDSNTKILMARLPSGSGRTHASTVRTAQTNVAAANPSYVKLIDADGYTLAGDNDHYVTASIVTSGADMYTAYTS